MSASHEFIGKPRLSPSDLAKRWGISRKTIYNWSDSGYLPPQHRIGTVEFWTEDQISAWEAVNIQPAGVQESASETKAH